MENIPPVGLFSKHTKRRIISKAHQIYLGLKGYEAQGHYGGRLPVSKRYFFNIRCIWKFWATELLPSPSFSVKRLFWGSLQKELEVVNDYIFLLHFPIFRRNSSKSPSGCTLRKASDYEWSLNFKQGEKMVVFILRRKWMSPPATTCARRIYLK